MKQYYWLIMLVWTAAGCQAPTTPHTAAVSVPPVAKPAADTTAAMLQLLRQIDLAPAWSGASNTAMEGFYGPDNYRISFYIDTVRRDKRRPNVFYFQGRDRYKRIITSFTGTLTVTRLAALPDTVGLAHYLGDQAYSAFASFVLREDSTAKGASHCTGRAVLDFQVNARNLAAEASFDGMDLGEGNPTKGCGQVFRGIWQDNHSGRRQSVAWANFYGVIVPDVLRNMGLGERGDEVDPWLARYGWNTIMENDEWWATSPKPDIIL